MSAERSVINRWLDRNLPLREEEALTYRNLAGVAIVGASFMGAETWNWVEKSSSHIVDPATAIGATATALATGMATFLWKRARDAEESVNVD